MKTSGFYCRRRRIKTLLRRIMFFLLFFIICLLIVFLKSQKSDIKLRSPSTFQPRNLPGPKVFLIETNKTKRYLTEMNSCSVESAARHHSNSQIIYYKHGENFLTNGSLLTSLVESYPNIQFSRLDTQRLFDGTPLDSLDIMDKITKNSFAKDHLSDIGRAALLYTQGGIYMDTDVIALRSMAKLRNAIGTERVNATRVNTAVMIFDKKTQFFLNYMTSLKELYSPSYRLMYKRRLGPGPDLISTSVQIACNVTKHEPLPQSDPAACQGIDVLPYEMLNPISYNTSWKIFFVPRLVTLDLSNSYTVHLSHSYTKDISTPVGSETHLDLLFKKHCPVTYRQIKYRIHI